MTRHGTTTSLFCSRVEGRTNSLVPAESVGRMLLADTQRPELHGTNGAKRSPLKFSTRIVWTSTPP